ncbi:MAG: restriction endonuclease [Pseudomonas sp.]|uniref:HNH endonuclease n=1 Tax=Pseudomonas sp. FEMGT703P TaxID=2080764 RepID=UPI000CB08A5B|nr:HNH endonuclease [Pseudomonas sp. FEMGT703P]PJE40123.1 MAG: restriction endonuclease [Pseudomonas sp.] [Pseudomonas sp. FEMGT703P]
MQLSKPQDLLSIPQGSIVTKRNLFDLIQYSKIKSSSYWGGEEFSIGNTPQQGINWIGQLPAVQAVVIKTRPGSYKDDGWSDDARSAYHYSFKARNSVISYKEKANEVLIKQPQHLYPILHFTECKEGWKFEGTFFVSEIHEAFVVLRQGNQQTAQTVSIQDEEYYQEGERRYVTHLMAERSKDAVAAIKNNKSWLCEICNSDFNEEYGIPYIEAHHKTPISSFSAAHTITINDLALLCPNCHKATHIYMKISELDYNEIKEIISAKVYHNRKN